MNFNLSQETYPTFGLSKPKQAKETENSIQAGLPWLITSDLRIPPEATRRILDLTPTTGAVLFFVIALMCHKGNPVVEVDPEYKKKVAKGLGIKYGTVNSKLRYLVNNQILDKHPNAYSFNSGIHLMGLKKEKSFWKRILNIK